MYKPPYNPIFDDPNNPKAAYNKRYRFLYYLSGLAMQIYNKVKFGLEVEIYTKLLAHLIKRDGFKVTPRATVPLYWDNTTTDETITIPLLVNDNVMIDIYSQENTGNLERDRITHRMDLAHISYGIIINFRPESLYSEWFCRDTETGIINKVKLI